MKKRLSLLMLLISPLVGAFSKKIVLSGNDNDAAIQAKIDFTKNLAGSFNQGFGFGGTNMINNPFASGCSDGVNPFIAGGNNDQLTAFLLQSDGKFIVGGVSNDNFALARFFQDGTLDPSFGQTVAGSTVSLIPGTVYIDGYIAGAPVDKINALAIDSQNRILVGGVSSNHFSVARFLINGTLDTTFGANIPAGNGAASIIPGTVYINGYIATTGTDNDQLRGLVIDSEGNIVVGGTTSKQTNMSGYFAVARFLGSGQNAGSLDTTFQGSGTTTTNILGTVYINDYIAGGSADESTALALDVSGKIMLGGTSNNHFALARFLATGQLDSADFNGDGGTTTTNIAGTVYITNFIGGGDDDQLNALLIDQLGNIVCGGQSNDVSSNNHFSLARFLTTGHLDGSFNGDAGTTTTNIAGTLYITNSIANGIGTSGDAIAGLVIDANNNILAGGSSNSTFDQGGHFAVARFTQSGPLDPTFGATIPLSNGAKSNILGTAYVQGFIGNGTPGSASDGMNALVLQPTGQIVAGGVSSDVNSAQHFSLACFFDTGDNAGALNSVFAQPDLGTVSFIAGTMYVAALIPGEYDAGITASTLQPDGKIIVTGSLVDAAGITHAAVARFLPNGLLDTTFGASAALGSGITSPTPGVIYLSSTIADGGYDQAVAVALQSDGKIVVLSKSLDNEGVSLCGLMRLLPNGLLDPSFGVTNSALVSNVPGTVCFIDGIAGNNDLMSSLVIQQDGTMIVGGTTFDTSSHLHFALARFLPNGSLDESFGVNNTTTTSSIPGTVYITNTISGGGVDNAKAMIATSEMILVGGHSLDTDNVNYFALAQFSSVGALVSSFGVTGENTASSIPGTVYLTRTMTGGTNDKIATLLLQSNGAIIAGGFSGTASLGSLCAFARFTAQGALDSSFGQTGSGLTSPFPGTVYVTDSIAGGAVDQVNALIFSIDGNILAGGYTADVDTNLHSCVLSLLSNGTLNSGFGPTNGTVPGIIYFPIQAGTTSNTINSLAVQSNGSIVAGGGVYKNDNTTPYFYLAGLFNILTPAQYIRTYGPVGAGLYG